ncbi:hypothetical protein F53441_3241 [Fusarium austroafricanum]|uniref:Zn(2)-C6 fungal-type domain-containing protein n=1 Tax=Fusarium austroafricanum TaxID=2364996 RepID=A0A8H4KQL2_9HYPO|nr:hypothetical protein F53441_3241 [Fusarium austroafricanum]
MEPWESKRLVPLLPAQPVPGSTNPSESESRSPTNEPSLPSYRSRKRVLVAVACEGCRRKKAKCDGRKPTCSRCSFKSEACSYEPPPVPVAVKKKYDSLIIENQQYRELFDAIQKKPDCEAQEIFNRLRASNQPLNVLESIRQAEVLLPNPTANTWTDDPRLKRLDEKALESSVIQVPAKPWTAIVGDGLISELITDFFTWDNSYMFPVLDRVIFVDEMKADDASNAQWCSALLVNAICAKRCLIVERAKQFGVMTGQNLTERFLAEAKAHLDREQDQASVPTVQALLLMYLTMTVMGRDRDAQVYRLTAYEKLEQLHLEERYQSAKNNVPPRTHEMLLISKTLWGIFLLESRIAYFYNQPSAIPPPSIPKPFLSIITFAHKGNADVLDRPWNVSSDLIPRVPGALAVSCSLAELLYEIMHYLTTSKDTSGSEGDIHNKRVFYSRLQQLKHGMPQELVLEYNLTPVTCFLRMDENMIAYTLLQRISLDTPFGVPYNLTAKDLCIQHCRHDVEVIESYIQKWSVDLHIVYQLYISMQILVPMLQYPVVQDLFVRGCFMMHLSTGSIKLSGILLQAIQAFAWATNKPIPEAAHPCLAGWTQETFEKDFPISFALPSSKELRELLASDGAVEEGSEWYLGTLIEKWAINSMDISDVEISQFTKDDRVDLSRRNTP